LKQENEQLKNENERLLKENLRLMGIIGVMEKSKRPN
jgi:hypothetical protein